MLNRLYSSAYPHSPLRFDRPKGDNPTRLRISTCDKFVQMFRFLTISWYSDMSHLPEADLFGFLFYLELASKTCLEGFRRPPAMVQVAESI